MILFWLVAALLSAGAAALMLRSAARARTEREIGAGKGVALLCLGAPLAAAGLYLLLGSPGAPDQAHAARVEAWRRNPESIGPAQAAAVLERIVQERPADATARIQLGRARLASGDAFGAVRAFEQAANRAPSDPVAWTALAYGLLELDPPSTVEATRALQRAQALAPADPDVRYALGRTMVAAGDVGEGVASWRRLAEDLPDDDPRRAALEAEIASASTAASRVDPAIESMVGGLAARLRAQPDDPEGWARLARAYAVLGREAELQAALGDARRVFAGRPKALQAVEAGAAEGRARAPLRAGG